jgi:hypothetical protein
MKLIDLKISETNHNNIRSILGTIENHIYEQTWQNGYKTVMDINVRKHIQIKLRQCYHQILNQVIYETK